jgi:hypothetical protein
MAPKRISTEREEERRVITQKVKAARKSGQTGNNNERTTCTAKTRVTQERKATRKGGQTGNNNENVKIKNNTGHSQRKPKSQAM